MQIVDLLMAVFVVFLSLCLQCR